MSDAPAPRTILGLLADDGRLRVVAGLVLGATTVAQITDRTQLPMTAVTKALERLVSAGLVERTVATPTDPGGGLQLVDKLFERAARDAARLRPVPTAEQLGATDEQANAMRNFLDDDGRLCQLPRTAAKRRPMLDFAAQRFEPGKVYAERDVNFELGKLHHDTAALRRYLVDEGFLERRDGFYWRAGGSFEPA